MPRARPTGLLCRRRLSYGRGMTHCKSLPLSLADLCGVYHHADVHAAPAAWTESTVVTAFFDIGREGWRETETAPSRFRRDVEHYFQQFGRLAKLRNPMVVFVAPEHAARVLALRRNFGLERQTSVVTIEKLFDQPLLEGIAAETKKRMTPRFRRWVLHPEFPEYREPLYVLVNALKAAFVNTAIDLDLVHTAQSAWVDFGYCHDDERFDPGESWRFDAGDRMNLFYLTELDELPIYRIVRYGTVYFQGCHVVGPTSAWRSFAKEIARAHDALLGSDLVDDDQTLMLMAWRRDPTQYRIHGVTSDDWRVLFRRFNIQKALEDVRPPAAPRAREESPLKEEMRLELKRWEWRLKRIRNVLKLKLSLSSKRK